MADPLEARIKRAADNVVQKERELESANEEYQALLEEASNKGIPIPRTILTNPFFPPRT